MKIPQSAFRNSKYENMLHFARGALGLSESAPIDLISLEGRGSDRVFFRLRWNDGDSAILVHYDPKRTENTYYAAIAIFLHEIDIPVPRMIRHDSTRCLILMEDLGDTDLWSFRNESWETRSSLYKKTLNILRRLHRFSEKDFPGDRVRLMEGFGPDLYRWERDYFRDHFVRDFCKVELKASFNQELEAELFSLGERLIKIKPSLVHRDLQSRNIMIRTGEPFLIDFQGMRYGSLFYDLGSLLCDPYVEFSEDQRMELLSHYYGLSDQNLAWEDFQKLFWEASAQRLMQALGAYGFLGRKKGLHAFLDHIPSGLRNLHHAAQAASLPRLRELCKACLKVIGQEG